METNNTAAIITFNGAIIDLLLGATENDERFYRYMAIKETLVGSLGARLLLLRVMETPLADNLATLPIMLGSKESRELSENKLRGYRLVVA